MEELVEVKGSQAIAILEHAASLRIALVIVVRRQNCWITFKSRMVAARGGFLIFELPGDTDAGSAGDVLSGQEAGMNFRLQRSRYFFSGTVSEPARWPCSGGGELAIMATSLPDKLERLGRRACERVAVPSGEILRANIWVGMQQEPVWSGHVTDLSMGGLQLRTNKSAMAFFDAGDTVRLGVTFGDAAEPLMIDAYFRHGQADGNMCLLGLEFASVNVAPEGRAAFEKIRCRIAEFRDKERRSARK